MADHPADQLIRAGRELGAALDGLAVSDAVLRDSARVMPLMADKIEELTRQIGDLLHERAELHNTKIDLEQHQDRLGKLERLRVEIVALGRDWETVDG